MEDKVFAALKSELQPHSPIGDSEQSGSVSLPDCRGLEAEAGPSLKIPAGPICSAPDSIEAPPADRPLCSLELHGHVECGAFPAAASLHPVQSTQ